MKVGDLMTKNVVTLLGDQTLKDAVSTFQRYKIRHLPIVSEGHLIGMVTDRDVKRATPSLLSGGGQEEYERVMVETRLSQIMTRDPVTVSPDSPLKDAVRLMHERKFGALPVVEDSRLIGIITDIDMLRAFEKMLD